MNSIDELSTENTPHQQLMPLDTLTGLLHRSIFEQEVNLALKACEEGTLLLIDVDDFSELNTQYGHFIGDVVLQSLAKILGGYFFPKDLVGRMGSDEFAIFLRGRHEKNMLEQKISRAIDRLAQSGKDINISKKLSFSVGITKVTARESFQSLYQCANTALLVGKQNAIGSITYYSPTQIAPPSSKEKETAASTFVTDVQHIRRQLRESKPEKGAYYPDYQKFMTIYHFLERCQSRTPQPISLILISLLDASGDFPQPEIRTHLRQLLTNAIQGSLRNSDIFTQYSSAQFLVMTPGANDEAITRIQNRIRRAMVKSLPKRSDISLHFDLYPL